LPIEAGAEFFQTQGIYDLDKFARFMKYARQFPVNILAGIILFVSPNMAKYTTENVLKPVHICLWGYLQKPG
jgi:methylenetetrahydrofolate reductase (NADPH)